MLREDIRIAGLNCKTLEDVRKDAQTEAVRLVEEIACSVRWTQDAWCEGGLERAIAEGVESRVNRYTADIANCWGIVVNNRWSPEGISCPVTIEEDTVGADTDTVMRLHAQAVVRVVWSAAVRNAWDARFSPSPGYSERAQVLALSYEEPSHDK